MVNITIAEGGGVVADGVVSLLPQCASVSYGSLSLRDAEQYDITSSSYFVVRHGYGGLIGGHESWQRCCVRAAWHSGRGACAARQDGLGCCFCAAVSVPAGLLQPMLTAAAVGVDYSRGCACHACRDVLAPDAPPKPARLCLPSTPGPPRPSSQPLSPASCLAS